MTNEEILAKMEALEKLAEQQAAEIAELKAAKPTTAAIEEEKPRELVVPTDTITVAKKKYKFVVKKFRVKYPNDFNMYIAEDEVKNTELCAFLVKKGYTHILKPA